MTDEIDNDLVVRRCQMITLMSAWSEDQWSAGWDSALDERIREGANDLWLMMAAACGGWPKGYRAEDGWEPLTAKEYQYVHSLLKETMP